MREGDEVPPARGNEDLVHGQLFLRIGPGQLPSHSMPTMSWAKSGDLAGLQLFYQDHRSWSETGSERCNTLPIQARDQDLWDQSHAGF